MVEHAAVNRRVVGSSPTRGATNKPEIYFGLFLCLGNYIYSDLNLLDMDLLLNIVRGNSYIAKNIPHDDSPKLPKRKSKQGKVKNMLIGLLIIP